LDDNDVLIKKKNLLRRVGRKNERMQLVLWMITWEEKRQTKHHGCHSRDHGKSTKNLFTKTTRK